MAYTGIKITDPADKKKAQEAVNTLKKLNKKYRVEHYKKKGMSGAMAENKIKEIDAQKRAKKNAQKTKKK